MWPGVFTFLALLAPLLWEFLRAASNSIHGRKTSPCYQSNQFFHLNSKGKAVMKFRAPHCASCGTGSCTEEEGLEPKHRNCNSTCPAATCDSRPNVSWPVCNRDDTKKTKHGASPRKLKHHPQVKFHLLQISTVAEMLQRSTSCINAGDLRGTQEVAQGKNYESKKRVWAKILRPSFTWWNYFNSQLAWLQPVRMFQCSPVHGTITVGLIVARRSPRAIRWFAPWTSVSCKIFSPVHFTVSSWFGNVARFSHLVSRVSCYIKIG